MACPCGIKSLCAIWRGVSFAMQFRTIYLQMKVRLHAMDEAHAVQLLQLALCVASRLAFRVAQALELAQVLVRTARARSLIPRRVVRAVRAHLQRLARAAVAGVDAAEARPTQSRSAPPLQMPVIASPALLSLTVNW